VRIWRAGYDVLGEPVGLSFKTMIIKHGIGSRWAYRAALALLFDVLDLVRDDPQQLAPSA
jgi:hypothetical protein